VSSTGSSATVVPFFYAITNSDNETPQNQTKVIVASLFRSSAEFWHRRADLAFGGSLHRRPDVVDDATLDFPRRQNRSTFLESLYAHHERHFYCIDALTLRVIVGFHLGSRERVRCHSLSNSPTIASEQL
jgi:hypothetical protein